jgi:hypothetical protein
MEITLSRWEATALEHLGRAILTQMREGLVSTAEVHELDRQLQDVIVEIEQKGHRDSARRLRQEHDRLWEYAD